MPIISLSLNEQLIEGLGAIQHEMGFSGRSETIRAAIRQFVAERDSRTGQSGKAEAVVIVIHGEDGAAVVDAIRHDHYRLIKTQIHHHIKKNQCMDLFVVKGQSDIVNRFVDRLSSAEEILLTKIFFL